ncbi:unnamed protein product [Withania somnifera]
MTSASSQRLAFGLCNLHKMVTWLFITLLILYLIYSFNLIFNKDSHECTNSLSTTSDLSTKELLSTTTPPSNNSKNSTSLSVQENKREPQTGLEHIVFGIAASTNLWDKRKEYIKLWWRPGGMRGVVWLDKNVTINKYEGLPEIRISGNTSKFSYTNPQGNRSALRISRVVSETLRLNPKDVRWFVMGDDDTVFNVDNVVRVLSKYDHNQYFYIGSNSESHIQNIFFSYEMAYGGGGFAISYPLAKELEKFQDRCIQRYPGLYGSDDRIQACMAELGVPLTREPGFHQAPRRDCCKVLLSNNSNLYITVGSCRAGETTEM